MKKAAHLILLPVLVVVFISILWKVFWILLNRILLVMFETFSSTAKGLAKKCNNPFNIRYSGANNWVGQTGELKGFCVFSSVGYGMRAGLKLLYNYIFKLGLTDIDTIIERFCPRSENEKVFDSKLKNVCSSVGLYPVTSRNGFIRLCQSLVVTECGFYPSFLEISRLCIMLNLKFI